MQYISLFFSFRWHGCKQSKMSEGSWVEKDLLYFWWTWRFSPPWLIYFWVTFYLGNLVDLNEISVLHWCVCAHRCMCVSVVTAIKWKKSPYQTICFSQWRLTAQRRRNLCWPWTADWTKEAYDTCQTVSLIPPSGRLLKSRSWKTSFSKTIEIWSSIKIINSHSTSRFIDKINCTL